MDEWLWRHNRVPRERGGEKLITPRWNRRKYAFDRLFNFSPRRTRLCEIGFRLTILVYSIAVNYRRTRSRSTRKNLRSRIDALETFVQSKSLFATEFCRRADGATASRSIRGPPYFPLRVTSRCEMCIRSRLNFFFPRGTKGRIGKKGMKIGVQWPFPSRGKFFAFFF